MKKISSSLQTRNNTELQSSAAAANSVYTASQGKIHTPRLSARSNNNNNNGQQSSGSKNGGLFNDKKKSSFIKTPQDNNGKRYQSTKRPKREDKNTTPISQRSQSNQKKTGSKIEQKQTPTSQINTFRIGVRGDNKLQENIQIDMHSPNTIDDQQTKTLQKNQSNCSSSSSTLHNAASDLLKHFQDENIILYPNSGTNVFNLSKNLNLGNNEFIIKPQNIIPYEQQKSDNRQQNQMKKPPKLSTLHRQIEQKKEEQIEYLQNILQKKWKKLKIPKLDRIHFKRLFFHQINRIDDLRNHLRLLESYKLITSKVMSLLELLYLQILHKIIQREKLFNSIKQFATKNVSSDLIEINVLRKFQFDIVPHLLNLRQINLVISQAIINDWRELLWLPQPFIWKSQNYLEKILQDYKEFLNSGDPLMRKLLIFVQDLLFFKPRKHDDIMNKLKALIDIHQPVPLDEVEYFHRICKELKCENKQQHKRIKSIGQALKQEQNIQKSLGEEADKMLKGGEFIPFLKWQPPAKQKQTSQRTQEKKIRYNHQNKIINPSIISSALNNKNIILDRVNYSNPQSQSSSSKGLGGGGGTSSESGGGGIFPPDYWKISPIKDNPGLLTLGRLPNIDASSGAFSLNDGVLGGNSDGRTGQNNERGSNQQQRSSSIFLNSQENAVESTASFSGAEQNNSSLHQQF